MRYPHRLSIASRPRRCTVARYFLRAASACCRVAQEHVKRYLLDSLDLLNYFFIKAIFDQFTLSISGLRNLDTHTFHLGL